MDAIILAAGKGKRIVDITQGEPKSFLTINGKRIIDWQLEYLRKNGVKNIVIVVGYKKELFYESCGMQKDITFVFNPFYEITNVLPSFWFGMEKLSNETIYLHADTVFDERILKKLISSKGDIILPIEKKKCASEDMKVTLNGEGYIKTLSKEIPSKEAIGEFIGILKISKNVIVPLKELVTELMSQQAFNCFFEEVLQLGVDRGIFRLKPLDITGLAWEEIDFKEDYDKASKLFQYV